jgi:uncharacterized protein YbjT (DUF2867 family)
MAGQCANVIQLELSMKSPSKTLRLMLVGSTGAVGQEVLRLALADARVIRIIAPTRRPLPPHPKLENPVVDFSAIPEDSPWWSVDAVVCTLGTTIKVAGSQAAFASIDRDLPLQVARLAQAAGATRFALNSSLGASLSGNFYLRTKAEAEQGIRDLRYQRFTIVRPSLIDAKRTEPRLAERAGLLVEALLRPLIPRHYRAVKAESIARALIEGVMGTDTGEQIIESEKLQK